MIRVLVIEDVRAVGEMIAVALRSKSDIEVAGVASSLQEVKEKIAQCDVILVNSSRGGEVSLHLLREIRKLDNHHARIVVLGLVGTPSFVLQCVGAGVTGYTLPESSLDELVRTLRAVYNNETVSPPLPPLPRVASGEMVENYALSMHSEPRLLTRREREVLSLVQQGLTNLEIAQLLVIELGTVKNHVHNILRKLRINSRRDTLHLSRASRVGGWKEPNSEHSWPGASVGSADRPAYSNSMARVTAMNTSVK